MDRRLTHEQTQELLGAYAIDAVEHDEAQAIERHLADCSTCRAELDEHRQIGGLLGLADVASADDAWSSLRTSLTDAEPPATPVPGPPALNTPPSDAGTGERFEAAFLYATRLHADQQRASSRAPYIAHPMAVASLVLEHGGSEDQAIAALLHDTVDDRGGRPRLHDIRRRFGETVAAIVEGCSDPPAARQLPWHARKEAYLARLNEGELSATVLLVALAEKLHNARCLLDEYRPLQEELWGRLHSSRDEQLWYYRELVAAFSRRFSGPLVEELNHVVAELIRESERNAGT